MIVLYHDEMTVDGGGHIIERETFDTEIIKIEIACAAGYCD